MVNKRNQLTKSKKRQLYKEVKKTNDDKARSAYKVKSSLFKNIVKNSKIKYNNSSILKSRNRSKTVWNIVKYELGTQYKDRNK